MLMTQEAPKIALQAQQPRILRVLAGAFAAALLLWLLFSGTQPAGATPLVMRWTAGLAAICLAGIASWARGPYRACVISLVTVLLAAQTLGTLVMGPMLGPTVTGLGAVCVAGLLLNSRSALATWVLWVVILAVGASLATATSPPSVASSAEASGALRLVFWYAAFGGVLATAVALIGRAVTESMSDIRELTSRLRIIYDTTAHSLFQLRVEPNDTFRFVAINRAALLSLGVEEDRIIGKTTREVIPEPSYTLAHSNHLRAVRQKSPVTWEEVTPYPSGLKVGLVSVAPAFDENGRCTHLIGSVNDVTELRLTADNLGERLEFEQCARKVSALLAGLIAEPDTPNLDVIVREIGEYLGVDRCGISELADDGESFRIRHLWVSTVSNGTPIVEEDLPVSTVRKKIADLSKGAVVAHSEGNLASRVGLPLTVDGKLIAELWATSTEKGHNWTEETLDQLTFLGDMIGVGLVRQREHTALAASEARYEALVDNLPEVISSRSQDGSLLYVSESIRDLSGYTPTQLYQAHARYWFDRVHSDDRDRVEKAYHHLFAQGTRLDLEYQIQRKDGRWLWLHDRASRVVEDGGDTYAVSVASDVTERKALEERLVTISDFERQRLGEDLHDDLGQRLAALLLYVSQLGADSADPSKLSRIEAIKRIVQESIHLTRNLAQGLNPIHTKPESLEASLQALLSGARETSTIIFSLTVEGLPSGLSEMAAVHVFRICQEAVHNVIKHSKANQASVTLLANDDPVLLQIRDDGVGFTTSTNSEGMGLSTMKARATLLGGTFVATSAPGEGTLLEFSIPFA